MYKNDRSILIWFYIVLFGIGIAGYSLFSCYSAPKKETKKEIVLNGFIVTAYCPGSCCNDKWAGMTTTGHTMLYFIEQLYLICAVDPKVIPLYTIIEYDGAEYLACDTGGAIKGKHIDILFANHKAASNFGIKKNQSIKIKGKIK